MQTNGLTKSPNLISPPVGVFVPPGFKDERKATHSTVKEYFRLKGFKPTHDFILVETIFDYRPPEDVEIAIPDSIKNQQQTSRVIAVGPGGRMPNGEINYPCCKEGDLVFVSKGNYEVLKTEDAPGREFKLIHDSRILGIFSNEDSEKPSTAQPLETTEP